MKRTAGILVGLLLAILCTYALADVELNETNFPDAEFRKYITDSRIDWDGDGILSEAEIQQVTDIYCSEKNITDLTGIEYFTELTELTVYRNDLNTLDVSKNTKLTYIYCDNNNLTNLVLRNNTVLEKLNCNNNNLTNLDLTNNTALKTLLCSKNQLNSLDLRANTVITTVNCSDNQITSLLLSEYTPLNALAWLTCNQNQIQTIDVSNCPILAELVQTQDRTSYGTSDLWTSSGKRLEVDTTTTVIAGETISEPIVVIPEGIEINETSFPDENFRSMVQGFDGNDNGYLSDWEISLVRVIYGDSKSISSLQGIEYFTAMELLYCEQNQLTSLNLSKNTALEVLYCDQNQLTSLDLSKNTALTEIQCGSNELISLDVSGSPELKVLGCSRNSLETLDVSRNTALKKLWCGSNQLKSLDLSANAALTELICYSNQLTALDLSKNTAVTKVHCYSNEIESLDVSNSTALIDLECDKNRLTKLDVSNNKELKILTCNTNNLKELDISKLPIIVALVTEMEPEEVAGTLNWRMDLYGAANRWFSVDKDVDVYAGPIDIGKTDVTAIKDQVYTGKAIKPGIIIKYKEKKLTKGTDYTVSYKNNKKIGKATVTITGKGRYTGKTTVSFNIVPKAVKLTSLTAGKKELTVKWAKGSNITGYEIEYSLKKNFKGSKTVTIKKAATTKTVLKKLQAKKTYYIRIRTYKTVNGKKYYSAWSAIKNKKTK